AIKDGADFSFEMLYAKIVQFEISNARGAGFGLSAGGLSGRIDFNLKKEIFDMLADGIKEGEVAYGFAVSGAIFAQSLALNWHSPDFIIPGLFFSITGAHYVPVLYIPRSNMDIKLLNKDRVEMGLDGAVRAYMPFRVFDMLDGNGVGPIDWGGVDVSVQVEYALFPILDLGFTALNIPLVPAALHASSMLVFNPARNAIVSVDNLVQQDFKLNTGALTDFEHVDGTDERWVTRPLRLDVYALFRPFRNDFLVLRPNIGFTTLNPSEDAYFNLGLETSLNCGRWFTFSWFTGGYDGLCRNRLGFDLRLWKIARGYLNVETRSQDYIGAWTVKGVAVEIGAKWGGGFSGLTNF
ncbi:MAG: hypothetical protein LBC72_04760, partial [Spirochaetaceae bacterium]|nr:hypothetical protein [Spirochaetaceae bacterium]